MRWSLLFVSSMLIGLTGCQQLIPAAPGLRAQVWPVQSYNRQDQVDIYWHGQSFSFLLYQQQKDRSLELLALSLTGQQLFQIEYSGKSVEVKQRISEMRLLPFEFLIRDILLTTYPNFAQQQQPVIQVKGHSDGQEIWIKKQRVLLIQQQTGMIELSNVRVPYRMTFSPIENTLQSDE